MATRDEVRRIKKKIEKRLLEYRGVTGVNIGFKTVNGEKTDELAIIVYVKKKGDVSPEEALPTEIEGVPVDVVQRTYKLF